MTRTYRIGLVGLGDIALRRHVPVIARSDRFELVATASQRDVRVEGVAGFLDYRDMLADPHLDAVAICTPPGPRFAIARDAMLAGKHVLLEKPTTATLGEATVLEAIAAQRNRVAYATWHSQNNLAVDAARELLSTTGIRRLNIRWHEDVHAHHAGQRWIWQAGGFGVFDAGINALSIVTAIAPRPLRISGAALDIPENAQTPAAVRMTMAADDGEGDALAADFDWLRPTSDKFIRLETAAGQRLEFRDSGGTLIVDGQTAVTGERREYDMIYERFSSLLDTGRSDMNVEPLRLVADALLIGERRTLPLVGI